MEEVLKLLGEKLNKGCSIGGCERKHKAKGYCPKHYDLIIRKKYFNKYRADYNPSYYQKNKEKLIKNNKKYSKEYRKKNKELLIIKARTYRENNKEKIRLRTKKYRQDHHEEILEKARLYREKTAGEKKRWYNKRLNYSFNYLGGKKCRACGITSLPGCCYDFNHLRDKKFAISSKLMYRSGWIRLREELDKCEILCSNCHRIYTVEGNHFLLNYVKNK